MNKRLDKLVKAKTEELSATNRELEKALTELDTFIYKTSHDIKGPLARLLG
jgi:light-regulated signal transduction histidine kinase (bacteriophytochrome)